MCDLVHNDPYSHEIIHNLSKIYLQNTMCIYRQTFIIINSFLCNRTGYNSSDDVTHKECPIP